MNFMSNLIIRAPAAARFVIPPGVAVTYARSRRLIFK